MVPATLQTRTMAFLDPLMSLRFILLQCYCDDPADCKMGCVTCCPLCKKALAPELIVLEGRYAHIWGSNGMFRDTGGTNPRQHTIKYLECSQKSAGCKGRLLPTGLQYGLIRLANAHSFASIEHLYFKMIEHATNGYNVAAMHRTLSLVGNDHAYGSSVVVPSRHEVLRMFVSFVDSLDRASPADLMCPICKDKPRTLMFDGTRIGPTVLNSEDLRKAAPDTYFVEVPDLRKPLNFHVLTSEPARLLCGDAAKALAKSNAARASALTDLLNKLRTHGYCDGADRAMIEPIFEFLASLEPSEDESSRKRFYLLLLALSKKSPPCCVFNQANVCRDILEKLLKTKPGGETISVQLRTQISQCMPELSRALAHIDALPDCLRKLAEQLSATAFRQARRILGEDVANANVELSGCRVDLSNTPPGAEYEDRTQQQGEVLDALEAPSIPVLALIIVNHLCLVFLQISRKVLFSRLVLAGG